MKKQWVGNAVFESDITYSASDTLESSGLLVLQSGGDVKVGGQFTPEQVDQILQFLQINTSASSTSVDVHANMASILSTVVTSHS